MSQKKLHTAEERHAAMDKIGGFTYQFYCFLLHLLKMKQGETVSFEKLDDLSSDIRISERENRISTLMTCISSFPDPAMFNYNPKCKLYVRFYLEKLELEFNEYLKMLKAIKKEDITDNDLNRLSLALNSVKFVVIRTQGAFSDYHQNVTFNYLVMAINGMLSEIIEKGVIEGNLNDRLEMISEKYHKMIHSIDIGDA